MGVMGFRTEKERAPVWTPVSDWEALLRFDSGRALSFADAMRHTGIFGSNGTGKTIQGIVPAMDASIKSGVMELIIDPKGTLAGYARAIAEACGRAGDIIEFGTTLSATPINILEGMAPTDFFNFLMGLLRSYMDGGKSNNMDFHASSASCARDVFRMLDCVATQFRKKGVDYCVTLPLILELMNNPKMATEVFQKFLETVELTEDMLAFAKRIQGNTFHPLNQTEDEPDSEQLRQLNYHTLASIEAMTGFLEENGIVEKFCRPGAPGFDISAYEGKIIILSFGAGAAGAAALICRMACEAFYSWIYKQGVAGSRKFVIVDEFQEVCDLSSRRLSDTSFIALAREFNCGFLLATQSYSALAAKYGAAGLEALIANLNNKIFLHSEDILTRDSARALGSPDLIDLQKDAFAATFDSNLRNYVYGLESLNDSYARTCAINPVRGKPVILEPATQKAKELMDLFDAAIASKKKPEERPKQAENYDRERLMTEYDKTVCDYVEWDMEQRTDMKELKPDDLRIVYGRFFSQGADISVPAGWNAFLARMLEFFSGYGLKARIDKIGISRNGYLEAYGEPSGVMRVLNHLLALSEGICIRCGAGIEPNGFGLCQKCQKLLPNYSGETRCSQSPF